MRPANSCVPPGSRGTAVRGRVNRFDSDVALGSAVNLPKIPPPRRISADRSIQSVPGTDSTSKTAMVRGEVRDAAPRPHCGRLQEQHCGRRSPSVGTSGDGRHPEGRAIDRAPPRWSEFRPTGFAVRPCLGLGRRRRSHRSPLAKDLPLSCGSSERFSRYLRVSWIRSIRTRRPGHCLRPPPASRPARHGPSPIPSPGSWQRLRCWTR